MKRPDRFTGRLISAGGGEMDTFAVTEAGILEQRWRHPTLGEMVTTIHLPFTAFNLAPYEEEPHG